MLSNVRGDTNYPIPGNQAHHTPRPDQNRMPPVGNFAPTPSASRDNKRKRLEKHNAVPMPSMISGNFPVDPAARPSHVQLNNVTNKVSIVKVFVFLVICFYILYCSHWCGMCFSLLYLGLRIQIS